MCGGGQPEHQTLRVAVALATESRCLQRQASGRSTVLLPRDTGRVLHANAVVLAHHIDRILLDEGRFVDLALSDRTSFLHPCSTDRRKQALNYSVAVRPRSRSNPVI